MGHCEGKVSFSISGETRNSLFPRISTAPLDPYTLPSQGFCFALTSSSIVTLFACYTIKSKYKKIESEQSDGYHAFIKQHGTGTPIVDGTSQVTLFHVKLMKQYISACRLITHLCIAYLGKRNR